MTARLELRLGNDLQELDRLLDAITAFCAEQQLPDRVGQDLMLVLDEIFTNIVSYAYDDGERHEIEISLSLDAEGVSVYVVDDGKAFDPLAQTAPDLDADLDDRPIGGLGIHLLRSLMRDVSYRRENGHNVLAFARKLSTAA